MGVFMRERPVSPFRRMQRVDSHAASEGFDEDEQARYSRGQRLDEDAQANVDLKHFPESLYGTVAQAEPVTLLGSEVFGGLLRVQVIDFAQGRVLA